MKKKILLLTILTLCSINLVGCGSNMSGMTKKDSPVAEIGIDGRNSDEQLGFTYICDYTGTDDPNGTPGFRLYADNYTKIVYVVYFNQSGNGATISQSTGMSPWLSKNGKYCYLDTEDNMIKELGTDEDVNVDENTDEDSDSNSTSEENNDKQNTQSESSTENGGSTDLDQSVTNKINQNNN